jgi:hypothetical protein
MIPKDHPIFTFAEVYALKQLDGQKGTITYDESGVKFSNEVIDSSLDEADIDRITDWLPLFGVPRVTVFGVVHGKKKRFMVYDVKFIDDYLAVPHAANVAEYLKVPFVPHKKMKPTMTRIRKYKPVELRPFDEFVMENGERLIARYPDGR